MSRPTRLRLLVADDHTLFRSELVDVLKCQPDFQVLAEASDGAEVQRLAPLLRPGGLDLVLMDIDMPVLDGIAATAQIVAKDPDLPVVMLTVSTLDLDLF